MSPDPKAKQSAETGRPARHFEDLKLGETRRSRSRTVTEAEMLDFASKYDPQWFHADPELAAQSAFGGLIGSGIFTAALWRQLDHEINQDVAFVCGVAWEKVKWKQPLRPGDTIYVTSEIVDLRPSRSHLDRGVAIYECMVRKADGTIVLSFESVNLVYMRTPPPGHKIH